MSYYAQAVTNRGHGDPEIIVMCRHSGGAKEAGRIPLPDVPGKDHNLDELLRNGGWHRTTAWDEAPFGAIATVGRLRATYDLADPDRAAFVAEILRALDANFTRDGAWISLSPAALAVLRALPTGHDGHVDSDDDSLWIGGWAYEPEGTVGIDRNGTGALFDALSEVIHDTLRELGVRPLAGPDAVPVTPRLANALLPKILSWRDSRPRARDSSREA